MDFIYQIFSDDIISAVGWTVVHSLWQGALIALVLALVMPFLQQYSSRFRYEIALGALFVLLVCSVCTFIVMLGQPTNMEEYILSYNGQDIFVLSSDTSFWQHNVGVIAGYFETHLPVIVLTWLFGMLFFLLRMLGGYAYVQHIRFNHNQELGIYWQKQLHQLKWRMRLQRPVKLVESALVKVPMVIGHFKPMILMPLGAVNQLSAAEMEAVLAHELSHITRNDYLMNFFVSFVEVLFYYHPGVWWIAANVRNERENCCDDMAIRLCGNSLTYAKALVSLQEFHRSVPSFAMPFSGKKNHLLNRVKRILNQPQNRSNVMEKLLATGMMLVLLVLLGASSNTSDDPIGKIANEVPDVFFGNAEFWESHNEPTWEIRVDNKQPYVFNVFVEPDTIPGKKRRKIYRRTEGNRSIEVVMEGEDIKSLKIDGETVPESELEENEALVAEVLAQMQAIPTPPTPPTPPAPPSPPTPPTAPAPPTPPAPPSPSINWNGKGGLSKTSTRTITTERDENGITKIIISGGEGEETMEILVEEGDEVIVVDGNEMMSGDSIIIIEEMDFPGNGYGAFNFRGNGSHVYSSSGDAPRAYYFDEDRFAVRQADLGEAMKAREEAIAKLRENQHAEQRAIEELIRGQQAKQRELMEEYKLQRRIAQKEEREARERVFKEQREQARLQREALNKVQREQRELRERQLAEQHEQMEHLRQNREQLHQKHKIDCNQNNNLLPVFREAMIKDGLIRDGDSFGFELTDTKLKVNGEKQSAQIHQKYLNLYKTTTGNAFGKGKMKINQSGTNTSTSISRHDD